MTEKRKFQEASEVFRRLGGTLKTGDAVKAGIHPRTLYAMRDEGLIARLSRGLYRLIDFPVTASPDLVTVTMKLQGCVICLVSALAFHELTTQVPHAVYIAVHQKARPPRMDHPPIKAFYFDGPAFTEGIQQHNIDNIQVPIYDPEKTIADCFKFRNKIGLDVAVEALRLYVKRRPLKIDELTRYARICRVERVMWPYLEALL